MHTLRESEISNGVNGQICNNGHNNTKLQSSPPDNRLQIKQEVDDETIETNLNLGLQEIKQELAEGEEQEDETTPERELDIILNNVVCNYSVRCHLNLKHIAMNGSNVEFHKEMAMLIMKFRHPRCTASIWSSGKITMTGATTETDAKIGARRCARTLQKLGYNVKFTNYRIVNVLATCTMPFAIKIADFSQAHPRIASYEPELHPGVTYKIKDIGATLKIFSTGSITITAPSVDSIQSAVEQAYSLVYDFKNERRKDDIEQYPLSERKKRKRELLLLKQQQKLEKLEQQQPKRKRAKPNNHYVADNFINDEEEEPHVEEEDPVPNFKSPVDESEDEEEFNSDADHD